MTAPTLPLLWYWTLLFTVTVAAVGAELSCSGHGSNTSGVCKCEAPYVGDQCQICTNGFHGYPSLGGPCFLGCSSDLKLLSGFSYAGLETDEEWLTTAMVGDMCVWVIAPGFGDEDDVGTILERLNNGTHANTEYELTLHFDGGTEPVGTILIYQGLPQFFSRNDSDGTLSSLVASYSGYQLLNASISVSSTLLSVVYRRTIQQAGGLSVTVTATALNGSSQQEECNTQVTEQCRLSGEGCVQATSREQPFLSTLIPSLNSAARCTVDSTNDSYGSFLGCGGRYHHSAVYDPCSHSLWLYGGRDLAGRVCERVVVVNLTSGAVSAWAGSDEPEARHMHSAVLVPCRSGDNSSQMLVFGGLTESSEISDGLWSFSDGQWTQLANPPSDHALAGHSAVLAGERMVIIGGVRTGLSMSSFVLQYHLQDDSWEVLQTSLLGPAGLYGHSTVYDSITESVLVLGGYTYVRPHAAPSSLLYSLDLHSLQWSRVQLGTEVPAHVFHTSLVVGGYLAVYGGLVGATEDDLSPSSDLTLISLTPGCSGRSVVTFPGDSVEGSPPSLWGHAAVVVDSAMVVSGGLSGTVLDSVAILSVPTSVNCSQITNREECANFPDCASCNSPNSSIELCYNKTEMGFCPCENSESCSEPVCINTSAYECSQFGDCRECLSTDISQATGCLWCSCESRCVPAQHNCSCTPFGTTSAERCFLDVCEIPSCEECVQPSCYWISNALRQDIVDHSRLSVSVSGTEWGCYSDLIHDALLQHGILDTAVQNCPIPCGEATSCTECMEATNPNGGNITCAWASYSQTCLSSDVIPLLCSSGTCGTILSSLDQCPSSCSNLDTCKQCLQDPHCAWHSRAECVEVSEVPVAEYSYLHCLCYNDCSGHGLCVSPGNCSCELGYIGDYCSIECFCNGHSDCVDGSDSGRRTCVQCQHNTQGFSCEECRPFFVQTSINGSSCVSCHEFCHGNSDICIRASEYEEALDRNISLERIELMTLNLVVDGPSEDEVQCVDCSNHTTGRTCNSCMDGYFQELSLLPAPGVSSNVVCRKCQCNGHGNVCNQRGGEDCICHNNTVTPPCFFNADVPCYSIQCSACLPSYAGIPINNSQCYKEHSLNDVFNYTVKANITQFLAVPPPFTYTDIDIRITILMEGGLMDVYITSDSQLMQVTLGPDGEHVIHFASDAILMPDEAKPLRFTSTPNLVSHTTVEDVLTVVVPHTNPGFQTTFLYIAVLAREDSEFYFYYRQDPPRLNLIVFFGVFFSCFTIAAYATVLVWRVFHFIENWQRTRRQLQAQQTRGSRPFANIVVCFDKTAFTRGAGIPTEHSVQHPNMAAVNSTKPDKIQGFCDHSAPKKRRGRKDSSSRCDRRKCGDILLKDIRNYSEWPVCIQPTRDATASVSTVFIQMPSHKTRLYAGSALVRHRSLNQVKRRKLKANKCAPSTVTSQF